MDSKKEDHRPETRRPKTPPPKPKLQPFGKPKEERLRETITLLKKLQEVGISETDEGYLDAKAKLTAWVADGEAAQYTIVFARYSRRGELVLPRRAGVAASFTLKAIAV
jgi:hypothetical protein